MTTRFPRSQFRRYRRTLTPLAWLLGFSWSVLVFAGFLYAMVGSDPPDCGVEGTDAYYECLTGEELDLTPIQDEAQTTDSQERTEQP